MPCCPAHPMTDTATSWSEQNCDTLYFDGDCPICRREVGHLQARADTGLKFSDINRLNLDDTERAQRGQELHLRTGDGRWITGLEANVRAWQHTRLAPFARFLLTPLIRPTASAVYRLWLRYYHWQRHRRLNNSRGPTHD